MSCKLSPGGYKLAIPSPARDPQDHGELPYPYILQLAFLPS